MFVTYGRIKGFFCKQGGFYSAEICVERGATQGDVDSPVIFNLIIDAVLRKVTEEIDFGGSKLSFYADDGLLEHTDPKALQRDVDRVVDLFALFGLKANREKTKFMVVRGPQAPMAQNATTYNKVRQGGLSNNQWRKGKVICERCRVEVTQGSLRRHLEQVHGVERREYACPTVGEAQPGVLKVKMNGKGVFTPCPVSGCMG